MTVAEAIRELEKIEDKSMPLYFDCDHCGKALRIREIKEVAVVKTSGSPEAR